MYENHVAIAGQMMMWGDFRTYFDIDHTAFGSLSKTIEYLLSCGKNPVLPSKIKETAPDSFRNILESMGDMWSHSQLEEAIRDAYAFDFGHAKGTSAQKYAKLLERNTRLSKSKSTEDPFEQLSQEQDDYQTGVTRHDPSAFKQLDKYIDGGWEKKRMYTIGAYSNVGKSKLAYYIMVDALKKGKKCLFISLEVEKRVVLRNLASAYLNKTQNEIRKDGNCHMVMPRDNVKIIDDKYVFNDVASAIRDFKPDYVFLDFVQNLRNGTGSEYEIMTRNAGMLQQLAKSEDITLFLVSQTNNDSRFKNGEEATLRGSGALFHSSDLILTLHRETEADQIIMTIAKNKEGPAMIKFGMKVDFARGQWTIERELNGSQGF
jgi:predicted ATP-dependent serine protease